MKDRPNANLKKETKVQFNVRIPVPLLAVIEKAAVAAGQSQAEFIELCVQLQTDAAIEKSDQLRVQARRELKPLQEKARKQWQEQGGPGSESAPAKRASSASPSLAKRAAASLLGGKKHPAS
jgi:hypothetical protein